MSGRSTEPGLTVRAPRETVAFFGHQEAESTLLRAYQSGRIPHAWLIGGPAGIGKATLAYRLARFVFAHPDPGSDAVQQSQTLAVDTDHVAARRIVAGSHGGLLVLERTLNERGVLRTVISAEEARETVTFFGATAGSDGWRICIVDTVDDLNAQSANALLKILEEPPPRTLLLLLSNAPGRVLPTLQSRCRKLRLRALETADVIAAAATATDLSLEDPVLAEAAAAAEGSVTQALNLMGGKALGLYQRTMTLLDALPRLDPMALHALGDAMSSADRTTLGAFVDAIDQWLAARLKVGNANANLARLARLGEVWEKIGSAARDARDFNLERKPLVFSVFGMLAEAMR